MDNIVKYEKLIREYIQGNVLSILKESNSYLKYPFVDPGSVYDGNLWDWDSFWAVYSMLNMVENSLFGEEKTKEYKDLFILHAKGNIHNFFDNQLEDGYIPMMMEKNDLPEPYLNIKHKEGIVMNMHKPFLCQQIAIISGFCEDFFWVEKYFSNIEKYFSCYDTYYYNSNCSLYVWADDIMIGMDNDPATFGRPKFSTANMFLNGFMVSELKAAATIAEKLGYKERTEYFTAKSEALVKAIQEECFDSRDKFFYSVDVDIKTRAFDWFHKGLGVFWKSLPIKIRAWTGFVPLWSGIATKEQAAYIVEHITDKVTFNSEYGIASLAMDEKMYNIEATNNPSNWLGPIWIVVSYVVFRGLMNYGYVQEAKELCNKIITLLGEDIERTGTLHEFYDPASGRPIMNGGFLNWNLLVINMIDELKGKQPISRFI